MRVLCFGDAAWGAQALRILHAAGAELVGAVIRTNPTNRDMADAADELGLPIFQPGRCNAPEFLEQIRMLNPDLNISVSYDQILRKPILDSAPLGFANFHTGRLPFFRGRSVINWAIINGENEIGLTAHFVDEGINTGDIILQRTVPIAWSDSYRTVSDRVKVAFPSLVADTLELIRTGSFVRQKQSHLPGSYFPRRGPGDEILDWADTSRNLYNKIRGITHPCPGGLTWLEREPLTIWKSEYDPAWPVYIATPGQVVGIEPGRGARVKTGDATLLVTEAQFGDNVPFKPQWKIGTRLGRDLGGQVADIEARLASHGEEARHS